MRLPRQNASELMHIKVTVRKSKAAEAGAIASPVPSAT